MNTNVILSDKAKEAKQLIQETKGKWFSAYVLTDKGIRRFHATTNIKRFNKGISDRKAKDNHVWVYDQYARGVRTINVDNLISFKCGGTTYNKE